MISYSSAEQTVSNRYDVQYGLICAVVCGMGQRPRSTSERLEGRNFNIEEIVVIAAHSAGRRGICMMHVELDRVLATSPSRPGPRLCNASMLDPRQLSALIRPHNHLAIHPRPRRSTQTLLAQLLLLDLKILEHSIKALLPYQILQLLARLLFHTPS